MPFGGESAESYYDEGITASMRGDLQRAAECFETAVRKDSTMASAYQQLGRVYSRLGRHREADEPTAVRDHEIDRIGRDGRRRHREIALVLPILVVDDDDHPSGANRVDGLFHGREGRFGLAALGEAKRSGHRLLSKTALSRG